MLGPKSGLKRMLLLRSRSLKSLTLMKLVTNLGFTAMGYMIPQLHQSNRNIELSKLQTDPLISREQKSLPFMHRKYQTTAAKRPRAGIKHHSSLTLILPPSPSQGLISSPSSAAAAKIKPSAERLKICTLTTTAQ